MKKSQEQPGEPEEVLQTVKDGPQAVSTPEPVPATPEPAPATPEPDPVSEPAVSSSVALNKALSDAPRRRGRPRKNPLPEGAETPGQEGSIAPSRAKVNAEMQAERIEKCRAAGLLTGRLVLNALATQGPGFALQDNVEHEKMAKEFAIATTGDFFVSQNWGDLPPTLGLIIAWGGVALVLANKEENKGLKEKLKDKIKEWTSKKKD